MVLCLGMFFYCSDILPWSFWNCFAETCEAGCCHRQDVGQMMHVIHPGNPVVSLFRRADIFFFKVFISGNYKNKIK